MNRIDAIKQKRMNDNVAAASRLLAEQNHRNGLIRRVMKLQNRLNEMYDVAFALWENGYPLGTRYGFSNACMRNVTDGIGHKIGFFSNTPMLNKLREPNGYYGIENGGACGSIDLKIDMQTANVISGRDCDLERFLNGFDDAEKKFYEYVDKLTTK